MNIFNSQRVNKPKRNVFDLSHEKKISGKFGQLIPVMCQEVIPGDTFQMSTEYLIRFSPLSAPVMHMVNVYTHYFFVPNRIIWENWKDFITGGEKGDQTPPLPYITIAEGSKAYFEKGRLPDYFDVPTAPDAVIPNIENINALPFRAYLEIYNEYYRDQNLIDKVEYSKGDGNSNADIDKLTSIKFRAHEKDYFTSALPYAQKGGAVHIPISGNSPVIYNNPNQNEQYLVNAVYGVPSDPSNNVNSGNATELGLTRIEVDGNPANIDPNGTLEADLSNVTASTINELREAFQLQKWLERNMRSGSRYIESILAHFGVRSSDARLQRPEYLGGGKSPVVISEVLQTSGTTTQEEDPLYNSPQGNMAGHAVSAGQTNYF